MYFIGVDLGTSAVKLLSDGWIQERSVAVFRESIRCISRSRAGRSRSRRTGGAQSCDGLKELLAGM